MKVTVEVEEPGYNYPIQLIQVDHDACIIIGGTKVSRQYAENLRRALTVAIAAAEVE